MKWTPKQRAEMKKVLIESLTEVMDELEVYGSNLLVTCDEWDFKEEKDSEFFRSLVEYGISEKLEKMAKKRKEMNEVLMEANNILLFGNEEEEDEE